MIVSELSTQVNDLLRPMGITRNLSAYSILCQCLELVCEQEDRLQAVEKDIYTPIADRRRCEPKAIQSALSAGQLRKRCMAHKPGVCAAAGRLSADWVSKRGTVH